MSKRNLNLFRQSYIALKGPIKDDRISNFIAILKKDRPKWAE